MLSVSDTQSQNELVPLAVFDFDGTVINGQSGLLFSKYLFSQGYLSTAKAMRLVWWGARYTLHLPYRQGESREIIFDALSSLKPDQVAKLMHTFHDTVLVPRYRSAALAEVARRKEDGCITLLVSATFLDIARAAARYIGVDDLVATDMELDENGDYTGEVEGEVIAGPAKTRAVESWANEHIGEGKWYIAWAYGDHHSDQDLLGSANKAFAVSPGATLKRASRRKNWEILDWK